MKLPSQYRFADEKIKDAYYKLQQGDAQERELFDIIRETLQKLEENAFSGIQIPKRLVPQEYRQDYGITNLWKCNLPRGWRLMYSIARNEVIVISLILEWFDHKEYERRFNY